MFMQRKEKAGSVYVLISTTIHVLRRFIRKACNFSFSLVENISRRQHSQDASLIDSNGHSNVRNLNIYYPCTSFAPAIVVQRTQPTVGMNVVTFSLIHSAMTLQWCPSIPLRIYHSLSMSSDKYRSDKQPSKCYHKTKRNDFEKLLISIP